jgi:hypothetical protein
MNSRRRSDKVAVLSLVFSGKVMGSDENFQDPLSGIFTGAACEHDPENAETC